MKVYLDNAATTVASKDAVNSMVEIYTTFYGNPSSMHKMGVETELLIKKSRKIISKILKVSDTEIYFTSGGTESNNLAIQGLLKRSSCRKKHIITTCIEHPSVLNIYKSFEKEGYKVTYLKVDDTGKIDIKELESVLDKDTALVSIMHVNNEIGTIQDIENISKIIKLKSSAIFHVDGIQSFGKIECNIKKLNIDMFTMSSHKIHGPKGVGCIYVKKGINLQPLLIGGGQEKNIRPGTENVPGIVGFGIACEDIGKNLRNNKENMIKLRTDFLNRILSEIPNASYNGSDDSFAPHILNISFKNIRGEVLLHVLESNDILVSTGSACSSRNKSYSHVLKAIGLSDSNMEGTIRFSLSKYTTKEELDYVLEILKKSVLELGKIIKGR